MEAAEGIHILDGAELGDIGSLLASRALLAWMSTALFPR